MIQGASRGLGLGLTRALLERGERVIAASRRPERSKGLRALRDTHPEQLHTVSLDVTDEASVQRAAGEVRERAGRLHLSINAAGVLHDRDLRPERKLDEISAEMLQRCFAVNAFGPLLVAKHFMDLLSHGERAVFASISARVGSISDNRLGGWYAYRGSKAAQNMFTKGLSIEVARRRKPILVVALHPGTVDTDLSKPFQRGVKPEKLFSVQRASTQLLSVIDGLRPKDHGGFFAWDGSEIPW